MATFSPDHKGLEQFARTSPGIKAAVRKVTETAARMAKHDAPVDSGQYVSMIVTDYGESVNNKYARFTGWVRATASYSAGVEYPSPLPGDRGLYVLTRVRQRLNPKG